MLSSQRQEEEEAESQPFFKLSSQSKNASHSFFMFGERESRKEVSRNTSTSIFQDSSTQSKQASSITPSLLATPNLCQLSPAMPEHQYQQQQCSQQKQQESPNLQLDSMSESSDRLSLLHTRLHQEADKIRSWKVQTEMDLKQRERKLQDAQFTIDSQKKSILELQLQNENLSRKLKEEMDNRAEISERIESTRDMCNLLKDYTSKFQDKIALCENDRDELKSVEKQHMEELEELGVMFKDLSLLHTNKVNDLILTLETEKNSNLKNNEQLIIQLRDIQHKLKDLERQLNEKDDNISQLSLKKQEIAQQLTELLHKNSSLQKTLTEAVDKIQTQASLLEHADKDKQELQSDKDNLNSEKVELQQALQSHNKHIEELKQNIQSLKEHIDELTSDKEKITIEIQTLRENLTAKLGEIDALKDELKVVLEREKASYDKVDSIKQDKQAERAENLKLSELLKTANDEKQSLEGQLLTKEEEMMELKSNLEALQKVTEKDKLELETAVEKNKELEGEIHNLKEMQKEQDLTSVQELQDEKNKSDILNKDLAAINKQSTSLENKSKNLQGQLTSKTKQLKELQQELKTLKGKLTTQTKLTSAAETQVTEVTAEIGMKKTALEEMEIKFTSVAEKLEHKRAALEDLKTKLTEMQQEAEDKTKILQDLEAEVDSLRKKTEIAVKEHGDAKQACELQMDEVSATLNKYKAENERMVAQKDKEIEQLKKVMEQQKQNKKLEDDQASHLKKEVQGLKHELMKVQTERDEAKQQVNSHEESIQTLNENLKEKEDELKQLLSATVSLGEPMTGVSPVAPKRNHPLPRHSTPKHPAKQNLSQTPKTPLMTDKPLPLTPSNNKTPQRQSVLKGQTESVPRKRHVAFASDEEDSVDGSISDSSSSQLMEIELSEVERRLMTKSNQRPSQAVQPLHVTPSRKGPSPRPSHKLSTSRTPPSRPSPRENQHPQKGRRYLKHKKMRSQTAEVPSEMTQAELSRFNELYPEEDHHAVLHSSNHGKADKNSASASASAYTRKTPNRIFKVKGLQDTSNNRKKAKGKAGKSNEMDLSWFDSDAVYGFFD